jgi:hypothetical protein
MVLSASTVDIQTLHGWEAQGKHGPRIPMRWEALRHGNLGTGTVEKFHSLRQVRFGAHVHYRARSVRLAPGKCVVMMSSGECPVF